MIPTTVVGDKWKAASMASGRLKRRNADVWHFEVVSVLTRLSTPPPGGARCSYCSNQPTQRQRRHVRFSAELPKSRLSAARATRVLRQRPVVYGQFALLCRVEIVTGRQHGCGAIRREWEHERRETGQYDGWGGEVVGGIRDRRL